MLPQVLGATRISLSQRAGKTRRRGYYGARTWLTELLLAGIRLWGEQESGTQDEARTSGRRAGVGRGGVRTRRRRAPDRRGCDIESGGKQGRSVMMGASAAAFPRVSGRSVEMLIALLAQGDV